MDKRLSYFEKILLAEIDSLDDPEKGCYASNKYFMDFFDESERKIQTGLSRLKNLGYIIYEKFDGRIRTLRSNFYGDKSLFNTSEARENSDKSLFNTPEITKSSPLGCENHHPSFIGRPIEPDNKAYNKDKKEEHPPNPPEGGSVREACGAFVKLTKSEREALEGVYGASRVGELIEEINDYLASTGKKPYKDYAAAIRQWARRRGMVKVEAPKEDILDGFQVKKVEKKIKTQEQLDTEWFDKLESAKNLCESGRFQEFKIASTLMNQGRIWMYPTYIEFLGIPEAKFYYGEPGFRDKIDSALRKLNIVVSS